MVKPIIRTLERGELIAEPMEGRHILEVHLKIEIEGQKAHNSRIREAYRLLVTDGVTSARDAFLEGTRIARVTSEMHYDYRQLEGAPITWEPNGHTV